MIRSLKIEPFTVRVFRGVFPWLEGAEDDESVTILGRREAFILRQGNVGVAVAEICRKAGINQETYFNGRGSTRACSRPRCAG
jgi:hypothetical protein